jgi:signal peptidase I
MKRFRRTRRMSFADQKKEREKIRNVVILVFVLACLYLLLANFFFSIRVLENSSMNPGMQEGDRFVFLSFGIYKTFPGPPLFDEIPLRRGNIVLLDFSEHRSVVRNIAFSLVRFFTFGRISLDKEYVFMKRVIALPGDEVDITNFVARVQSGSDPYTYTEYEYADKLYYNNIPENDARRDESVPFSGNMKPIRLKEDEYFVLADDRSNTNDSRTWGPVSVANITGKAILRFWPFTRFGSP